MEQPTLKRPLSTLILGGIATVLVLLMAAVVFPALIAFMKELGRMAAESGDSIPQLDTFIQTMSALSTIYYIFAIINAGLTVLAYFKKFGTTIFTVYNFILFIINGFVLFLIPFIFNAIAINKAKKAHMQYKTEMEVFEKYGKEEVAE